MPPELPSRDELRAWLREHAPQPSRGWLSMLLGRSRRFKYRITSPEPSDLECFKRHRVFRVWGERGLLPLDRPETFWHLSKGIFAVGPAGVQLLSPGDDSLSRLLRAEGHGLEVCEPTSFVEALADLMVSADSATHVVVRDRETLAATSWGDGWTYFALRESEINRVRDAIVPPTISPVMPGRAGPYSEAGGWVLRFTSLYGHVLKGCELGVETVHVARDFSLKREPRQLLSDEICGPKMSPGPLRHPHVWPSDEEFWG